MESVLDDDTLVRVNLGETDGGAGGGCDNCFADMELREDVEPEWVKGGETLFDDVVRVGAELEVHTMVVLFPF